MYNERFTFEDNLSPLERSKVISGRFSDLSGAAKTQAKAGVNPFGNAVDVGFQVRWGPCVPWWFPLTLHCFFVDASPSVRPSFSSPLFRGGQQ